MANCLVEDCTRPHKSRGMCDTHYAYWRRTGVIGERRVKSMAERLWAKVDKTEGLGPDGDCWEWRGYIHHTGYGQMGADYQSGKAIMTHRAAWVVENGPVPKGLWVLHKCDNRACCNPAHLWVGTPKENTQDMIAKGRKIVAAPYSRSDTTLSLLTEEMVKAIRSEPPMTFRQLGAKYGVSAGTAAKVILRQVWVPVD